MKEAARLERRNTDQRIDVMQFEHIFDERLKRYDKGKEVVREEREAQIELIGQLREAHAAFTQAKKGESSNRKREEAIQSLESGYTKYSEIINNLEVGRRFYNDLAKIVIRFLEDCRTYAKKRNLELKRLERYLLADRLIVTLQLIYLFSDMSSMMSNLNLRPEAVGLKGSRSDEEADTTSREQQGKDVSSRSNDVRIFHGPAVGMWTPEMGIKFTNMKTSSEKATSQKTKDTTWNPSKGMKFN